MVDESIFVYAKRADISLYSELMRFLSLSDSQNVDRRFNLVMHPISRKRLGMPFFYHFSRYPLGISKIDGFDKRSRRRKAALKHVYRLWTLPSRSRYWFLGFIPFHNKRCLMDLYLFANEAKSEEYKRLGGQIEPNQVIPLEVCEIAQTAYKKNLPIFSFNKDFKFFCGLPNRPTKYIDYLEPDIFLANLDSYFK